MIKTKNEENKKEAAAIIESANKLSKRPPHQILFEETLNGIIDKKAMTNLSIDPSLWQNLTDEGQYFLAEKIKISEWFKANKRAKLKKKFENLLPLVDLAL